jgi:hypothetical protein
MMKKRFKLYGGTFLALCLTLVVSGFLTLMALRIVSHVIGYDLVTGHTVHGSIDFVQLVQFSIGGGLFGLAFNVPALIITYPLAFILSRKNVQLAAFAPVMIAWFTIVGLAYEMLGGKEMAGFGVLFFWCSFAASILIWLSFKRIIAWADSSKP